MAFGGNHCHFPFCNSDSQISFGYGMMQNQFFNTLIISYSEEIEFIDECQQARCIWYTGEKSIS